MEAVNEFFVYLLSVHFLVFSDLVSQTLKEYIGLSFFYLLLGQIGINMLVIVVMTLKNIKVAVYSFFGFGPKGKKKTVSM